MGKRRTCLLELGLGAHPTFLGALELGQIEYQADAGARVVVEPRHTDEYGHTAAVLAEVLLFERLKTSRSLELWQQSVVLLPPFRRCEIRPSEAARCEILAVVSHDTKKGIIGVRNPTVEIEGE